MAQSFNKEKNQKIISLVLEKIKTEADLQELSEYQKLFTKETSLFSRSKVAAYLLMLCDQGKTLRLNDYRPSAKPVSSKLTSSKPASSKFTSSKFDKKEERSDAQRYPLSEEESTRLFFSVGRSRRVFPREILGIINSKTAISKEDIGAIRILDNYSFVQVRDSVAEKIIEALNGMNFRGRTLTVNYAKSNKDPEVSANGSMENSAGNSAASEQDEDDSQNEGDI